MTGDPIPERQSISTKLLRIAQMAKDHPERVFVSLAHHIDIELLKEAYRRTRKDGATGIDGQTAADYAKDLEGNLQSLLDRLKSGRYRAPAVRRVFIPKGDGKETRPLGIPTYEDKVLQRAVLMVLEAIYEQDFLSCSFGFRPGRSARGALKSLWKQAMRMGGCWLLEVDVRQFFDRVNHKHLREILGQRVRDGVLTRVIGKWLNAGVMEEGRLWRPETGTPQGGVISPLLANVYLHEVVDVWFEREVKPRLKGRAFLIRYADDFVLGFEHEEDAQRVLGVLPKRLGRYGLTMHPKKTRLVDFRRPPLGERRGPRGSSFDFLSFTHFWGLSWKGNMIIRQKTSSKRLTRAIKALNQWCRANRHLKVRVQHERLKRKLDGHDAYFNVPGNYRALALLRRAATRTWRYWLDRRGQRRAMPWKRFNQLLETYPIPQPKPTCPVANPCT